MNEFLNRIIQGDCREQLKLLPDESVNCCVTSSPYYGLRDYGMPDQIGLEETPVAYISRLVNVFREVRRVLKDDGTVWVNIGDTYAGYKANTGDTDYAGHSGRPEHKRGWQYSGLKLKDLIGIPWMLAFALRDDGWYLRQDIIWSKPNPMPESVTDRCTKSHEYIFLLSKSQKYYFDNEAIKQTASETSIKRLSQNIINQKGSNRVPGKINGNMKAVIGGRKRQMADMDINDPMFRPNTSREYEYTDKANKRSVWTVSTKPFKEAHFATFPPELIVDCIKAGCPPGGVVLDPFMGSGTTAVVARKLDRNYIGLELNPDYIKIANLRIHEELGIWA